MANYFVDSNATYEANHANNGTAKETPWGGVGGLQRALGLVAAGENIYGKSGTTIDESKLIKVVCTGTLAGAIAVDDFVYCFEWSTTPTGEEGSKGQGYVVYVTGKTYYIHVTSGTWVTGAAHCITKENAPTYTNYIEAITVTKPGLVPVTAGTSVAAKICIIGCANDAGWTEDGTQLVLDGMGAGGAATIIQALLSWYEIRNVRGTRATGNAFTGLPTSLFINCRADGSTGGYGFIGPGIYYGCMGDGNNKSGFGGGGQPCHLIACNGSANTESGVTGLTYSSSVIHGVFHGNGRYGITISSGMTYGCEITGNVIDGNTRDGISVAADSVVSVFGNRITNNSVGSATYYGINAATSSNVFEDWNVFYNNANNATPGTQHRNNVRTGAHSLVAANTTEEGYTSYGDHDFNLTAAAILRSTALVLP